MTEEVEVPEEIQEAVQEDDAAFAAGFAEARGDEPVESEPEVVEEVTQEVVEEPQPEEQPAPPVVAAGLTDEQLTALLARLPKVDEIETTYGKRFEQVYGKFGEMQRTINELKGKSGGEPVRLTPEGLKRMHAEFPEMAQMLAEDLSEVIRVQGGTSFDPSMVEPLLQERENKIRAEVQQQADQKMEQKLLTLRHRDWQNVVASDEFAVWQQTLPAEDQNALNNTWDSLYLGDKLDEFKEWRDRSKQVVQERQNRLQAAVTPQGLPSQGAPVQNDDDAFLAGWKAARS